MNNPVYTTWNSFELLQIMNYFASSIPSMNCTFTDMGQNLKAEEGLMHKVDGALPVFRNAVVKVKNDIGWSSAVASHGYSWDIVRCYYCVKNPPKKSKGNELIRLRCVVCHSAGAHNNCVPRRSKSSAANPNPWVCPICCDEDVGAPEGLGWHCQRCWCS